MYELINIEWLPLPHCPPGQLTKPKEATDAGYDLMCAEDIYVPTFKELDEWGAYTWEDSIRISELDDRIRSLINEENFNYRAEGDDFILQNKKYKFPLVKTGVCIKPRSLMWSAIYSRSGIATKYNCSLANSVAVIDYSYNSSQDELFVALIATHSPVVFKRGTRIAQLVPTQQVRTELVRVDDPAHFNGVARGGFASSGLL